jgi:hypothetical protein
MCVVGTPVLFSPRVRRRRCSQAGQDVLRQDAAVLRYVPRAIRIMHAQKSAPFPGRAPDVLARLQLATYFERSAAEIIRQLLAQATPDTFPASWHRRVAERYRAQTRPRRRDADQTAEG